LRARGAIALRAFSADDFSFRSTAAAEDKKNATTDCSLLSRY
jgi:hypothetical protein